MHRHTCALQVRVLTNGERAIKRIEALHGQAVECGADGSCAFNAALVNAHVSSNEALRNAVSRPARRLVSILGRIC
jgi:hypothetical protein